MGAELLQARRLVALQYFAHIPPKDAHFQWPFPHTLFEIQDSLLDDLSLRLDQSIEEDASYKRSFLKEVITRLEAELEEINGEILEVYVELMITRASTQSVPSPRKVTYYYPTSKAQSCTTITAKEEESLFEGWEHVTLEEEASTITKGSTGLKTCFRLAAHLLSKTEIFAQPDLRILEVGSGSGLLGAVIAKEAHQGQVHLTDLPGIVLDRLNQTIQENTFPSSSVYVTAIDWLEVEDKSSDSFRFLSTLHPHLIVATDVVFDPDLLDPFCKVLRCALEADSDQGVRGRGEAPAYALVATTIRNEQTFSLFLDALDRAGLLSCRETLMRPMIDLVNSRLVKETLGDIELFPISHSAAQDGAVALNRITIR